MASSWVVGTSLAKVRLQLDDHEVTRDLDAGAPAADVTLDHHEVFRDRNGQTWAGGEAAGQVTEACGGDPLLVEEPGRAEPPRGL